MKTKINPVFGIEIECAYDPSIIGKIVYDGHHATEGKSTFSNGFYCEYDSSIKPNMQYSHTVEINSVPFQLEQFDRVIDGFKSHTMKRICKPTKGPIIPLIFRNRIDKSPQIELEEAFNFNQSTGCHIHITPLIESKDKYFANFKGKRFNFKGIPVRIKHLVTMDFLNLFRKRLFKRVKKELPHISDDFEKYYYRAKYSSKFKELNMIKQNRYYEFNLTNHDTRLEFRSFHLNGVKTWADFKTILKIVLEVAKDTFEYEMNKEEAFLEKNEIDLKKTIIDYAFKSKINEKEVIQEDNLNEVYINREENISIRDILSDTFF